MMLSIKTKRRKEPKKLCQKIKYTPLLIRESPGTYMGAAPLTPENFGTFADSKTAPIHRWFQYPAGFSYKAAEWILNVHSIKTGDIVYDPFVGTGTTSVVCKGRGIESYGVEAHPFVYKIAKLKTTWNYDFRYLRETADDFIFQLNWKINKAHEVDVNQVPELVRKCFSASNLQRLIFIRDQIEAFSITSIRDLFSVALTCALRNASAAATGWPYIAPKKRIQEKDGVKCFTEQLYLMIHDLESTPANFRDTPAHILLADARKSPLQDGASDLSFTSPPYLNNYDYADRTRLETYFNGFASTWREITEKIRSRLIISATTQINRMAYNSSDILIPDIKSADPLIAREIQAKVNELSGRRKTKGGRKSYDIMVGQYFNDLTLSLIDNYRVLKPGACFVLILGDSAPYGVYIPTEEYLGRIGLGVGFREYSITKLRGRGDKWKGNPQRHHVQLKESILTLKK